MSSAAVVRAADVQPARTAAGASVRLLLDASAAPGSTGPGLVRRLVDVPPRARFDGVAGVAGELWFVIEGSGRLDVGGHPGLALSADHGVWIPPGAPFRLSAEGPADLRLDAVTLPPAAGRAPDGSTPDGSTPADSTTADSTPAGSTPAACDLRGCEVETTGDRRFRVLFGPGRGCAVATQFVGEIPPGRAPEHSHPYDEMVLILQGEGVVHVGGADHALAPGTCTHLPPGQPHCLENTGTGTMRVLGVFHPADSPAAKLAS